MNKRSKKNGDAEELLVFGYACKVFRDDEKAHYIDQDQHLIPWMENSSLMIDRYDVRGALYDLEPGNTAPAELSEVEKKEEEVCEYERYFALYHDELATIEREEEEKKRLQVELESRSTDYKQIGFSYDGYAGHSEQKALPESQTGYVPNSEDDIFIPPPTLPLPPTMIVPTSIKQHKIIVKTAKFLSKQGVQMEIVLKTKQANNPMFGFLSFDNHLNKYYKHLLALIKAGKYNEEETSATDTDPQMPPAIFNPSADAAPGVTPPKKVSVPPPVDCSYSKLITKFRENQAKSAVVAPNSRSQSPTPALDGAPLSADTDADSQSNDTTLLPANAASVAGSVVTPSCNNTRSSIAPASSSTPYNVGSPTLAAVPPASNNKPFAGLVDYPSFNNTYNNDYASTTSSDDSDSGVPFNSALLLNGGMNGKYDKKPKLPKGQSAKTSKSDFNKQSLSTELNSVIDSLNNMPDFSKVVWPSSNQQMVIDKIACYVIKMGAQIERSISAKDNRKFAFLSSHHKHHEYYQHKIDLYKEIFGGATDKTGTKRKGSSSQDTQQPPTISFSLKKRKEGDVSLPPTSFPLESSSSEEETDDLDPQEKERRLALRTERKNWRKMKREQFEREKKDKELLKKEQEDDKLKALNKQQEEDDDDGSGNEEMYDIFKYAQEEGSRPTPPLPAPPAPKVGSKKHDSKQKRKKAAHAFLSKLKTNDPPPMIGPVMPPEMIAQMMDISPAATPPHDSPSPPPVDAADETGSEPPPPAADGGPVDETVAEVASVGSLSGVSESYMRENSQEKGIATTPEGPAVPDVAGPIAPVPALNSLGSLIARNSAETAAAILAPKRGLLAAEVSSILNNEDCVVGYVGKSLLDKKHRHRDSSKTKTHKSKHRRETSRSSSRERSSRSSKKKKRSSHRKKHRHGSSAHSKVSSHHHAASSSSRKKKHKKEKTAKKSSKKSRKRHRSSSVSSESSVSSDGSSRASRSRSSSPESLASVEPSKKRRKTKVDEKDSDTEHEVQVISDSEPSSSRASSVMSVRSFHTATPPPRSSSDSRTATPTSTPSLPGLAAPPTPLSTTFEFKTSSAMAKISQGLRAKVHALMDKKRTD